MNIGRRGFTLIEILIVVAIIAILASVVLIGLGPTQQAGRDARRLSDLREVQNGLELFYQDCGFYPGGTPGGTGNCLTYVQPSDWTSVGTAISYVVPNAGQLPNDPTAGKSYSYWYEATPTPAAGYVLGALLENPNNSVFQTYTPPNMTNGGITYTGPESNSGAGPQNCGGSTSASPTAYCISL